MARQPYRITVVHSLEYQSNKQVCLDGGHGYEIRKHPWTIRRRGSWSAVPIRTDQGLDVYIERHESMYVNCLIFVKQETKLVWSHR